ncbi:MAG: hypothetical protein AAF404_17795 [Pseudomonadota bacterium]
MGIWLIYYGIAAANRDSYLHWFEGQHIDEKLARPGYDWACHYEVTANDTPQADHSYIAMFGSESTRTFFDPNPAQIKPHQNELTRSNIAHRINPTAAILTQEWCELPIADKHHAHDTAVINSPVIKLGIFAPGIDDQQTVAWCAQQHFPALSTSAGLIIARKWLASFGANRHMVVEEYCSESTATASTGQWQHQSAENLMMEPATATLRVFKQ